MSDWAPADRKTIVPAVRVGTEPQKAHGPLTRALAASIFGGNFSDLLLSLHRQIIDLSSRHRTEKRTGRLCIMYGPLAGPPYV